jgi:hypothetical protein
MSDKLTKVLYLHPAAQGVVKNYINLSLGGKRVVAPYFMNTPGRKGRRVAVGKGTAKELERETVRLAKRYKFDLNAASQDEIRNFMIDHKLGIDCSGLVAWLAHELFSQQAQRPLWQHIQYKGHPLRVAIIRRIRPVENLSARLLTDTDNATTLQNLSEVRPGDIIRSLNGNHVLFITEVGLRRGVPTHFGYVNSTEYGGVKYGVRYGRIKIVRPNGHILDQEWIDGENGVNWIFDAANNYPDDTRVVRLKALSTFTENDPLLT